MPPNFYEQVYAVVRRIPAGKVSSYGRIAHMLGRPQAARAVGYALHALKDHTDNPAYDDIPWQRVINSQGRISIANPLFSTNEQAELLRAEGVPVDDALRIPGVNAYWWIGLHLVEIDDILEGRMA